MKIHQFILLFLLPVLLCRAQVFPVSADLQLQTTTFESVSVLGGFGTSSYPVRLRLLLNDLSIPDREVTLRFRFTGEAFSLSTLPFQGSETLLLESGLPFTVPLESMVSYFSFEQLTGIRYDTYVAPLPEGYYEFCVEVVDVLSGKQLSASICERFYHNRREPPLLLSPERGAKVEEVIPQAVYFQWTPRWVGPGAVLYRFSLVELWDNTQDPLAAFLASPPIYETITATPSFLYDLQATPLLPDKRYAWRVSEIPAGMSVPENAVPITESEVFWFDYVTPCAIPGAIRHEVKGKSQANITWEDDSSVLSEYTVRYRKAGEGYQWFYSSTAFNWITLWGLEGETRYEYQVLRRCELSETVFSASHYFTTGSTNLPEDVLECGIAPSAEVINQVALRVLQPGETFRAGDFTIEVHEVKGADGRFSGKGTVRIPYLANIRVGVKFTNVFINQERELVSGVVLTVYDKTWTHMLDVDEVIDVVEDIGDAIAGDDVHTVYIADFEIGEGQIEVHDGKVLVTAPDGSVMTIDHDQGDVILITDGAGNQWQVSPDGEVAKVGTGAPGGGATPANTSGMEYDASGTPVVSALRAGGDAVTFFRKEDTRFALDRADTQWKRSSYPVISDGSGEEYYPVHKAVVSGDKEYFYARLDSEVIADSLVVKTKEGRAIPTTTLEAGRVLRMELSGLHGYREEQVLLCSPDLQGKQGVIATFYLHHLNPLPEIRLILVPGRDGAIPGDLQSLSEKVFAPVGVTLKVEKGAVFSPPRELWDTQNRNGLLDYNGSGILADYPSEFRNYQQAFMSSAYFDDPEACYLFFPGEHVGNTAGVAGFMPVGRQWGYVFHGGSIEAKGSQAEVALHEIGHGILSLEHPEAGSDEGSLMGSGQGIGLSYSDWKSISRDRLRLHWFDDDEDQEIGGRVWFTPDWVPFRVPGTRVISSDHVEGVPDGAIPGFRVNGEYYHATMGEAGFSGYFNAHNEEYKITEETKLERDDKVYLFKQDGGCGYNRYYSATYGAVQQDLPELRLSDDAIYTYEATIPCDTEVSSSDVFLTRICEQGGSYDLPEAALFQLARVLESAHMQRNALAGMYQNPVGEFYHLINFREGQLGESQQALEDKLFLLKALTGINFYVLGYDTSGLGTLNDPEKVAHELLELNPDLKQEKTVLIFAGYNNLHTDSGIVECTVGGMDQTDEGLVTMDHFTPGRYSDLYSLVYGAFSALEKPYVLHRFYLRANGEIIHTTQRSEQHKGIRGLPYLYGVEFYGSPHLDEIDLLQAEMKQLREIEGEMLSLPDQLERFRDIRREWMHEMNALISQATMEEEDAFELDPHGYWMLIESPLGSLREALLEESDYLNAFYATVMGEMAGMEQWKTVFGKHAVLAEDDFYGSAVKKLQDNVFYGAFDAIAMVPHPYTEAAGEIGGMIYAAYRGDLEMAGLYSTALVIPFSGIRQVIRKVHDPSAITRKFAAFAVKEGDGFTVVVKSLDEAGPGELQLTPVMTNRKEVALKIQAQGAAHYKHPDQIMRLLDAPLKVKQLRNLRVVEWSSYPNCYNCERGALEFWTDESKEVVHYVQNKYYIKHDLESGEVLFGNTETGEILAYMRGEENSLQVQKFGYDGVLEKLKKYKGAGGEAVTVDLEASNLRQVTSTPGKCTTIIGKFKVAPDKMGDMEGIILALLGDMKHQMFDGPCTNGFNVLNVCRALADGNPGFWKEFNVPWLMSAIERGDEIYAATDPMDLRMVFKDVEILSDVKIANWNDLNNYLNELEISVLDETLTGFGKEIHTLVENGYNYDFATKKFMK